MTEEIFSIEDAIPHNQGLLMKKVFYGPKNEFDNEDKSDVWFEIVIPPVKDKAIEKGDLVLYAQRFHIERKINGVVYAFGQSDQVELIIKKKDVKESLFRQ